MTQTDIHTPKGFRDILPDLAQKRRKIINTIVPILEKRNFVPIETPIVEFAETLTGKYGEEERLIYKFTDRGDRNLALRFDLTVPLARYIATYNPPLPFRRYQIGQVFRGENPQRGRWREFTQLDFDTVGSDSLEEDAKIIACALDASRAIGLKKAIMAINDRKNFEGIPLEAVRSFDKINKIRESGVRQELSEKGFTKEKINEFINRLLSDNKTEDMLRIEDELKKYKDENEIIHNIKEEAYWLSTRKHTYEELCWFLAERRLKALNNGKAPFKDEIKKKAEEITKNKLSYSELCWFIAKYDVTGKI